MKLSIIVPVYNVKDFLQDCVESLLYQLIDDYEIILVDDGATDGSGEMVSEYAEKYPGLIKAIHIDNGGQGRARNFGLEIAQGDYIGFVDSDDWVTPDMYLKLYELAVKTGADTVICDFMAQFKDGGKQYLPSAIQQHRLAAAGSACNKLFKREIVGDVRFPVGLWYEDFYFSAMMLIRSAHVEFIREPLYNYRCWQLSTMRNNNAEKNLDIIQIMNMLAEYMIPRDMKDDLDFFIVNHILLDSINRLNMQSGKGKFSVIRKLRDYSRKMIPNLNDCESFKQESIRRRTIIRLNYYGFSAASHAILGLSAAIKHR